MNTFFVPSLLNMALSETAISICNHSDVKILFKQLKETPFRSLEDEMLGFCGPIRRRDCVFGTDNTKNNCKGIHFEIAASENKH
ncbi:hypothetical protein CEXT_357411 [Caerostris extrusa]|uniref:Uncharacterized protein n=1 Tax=Caerostris extrusa TaxID=172846 RepID=A0AAV4XH57_CAEEX|nr:hypothetical protein CEXT_357411 [Caerostris extrusa]